MSPADTAPIARALGLVYLGGPTVAIVALLLPHSERTDDTAIWILCAIAYAMVPVLFGLYRRLPLWAFEVIVAFAALLVTLLIWFDGDVASEFAFFYLWPVPFAFVFFTVRRALALLAFTAVAYGAVLALIAADHPGTPAGPYWLLGVTALIAVGLLVRALHLSAEEARRKRALEINDSVLQGLVVARVAQEQGLDAEAAAALEAALVKARAIVTEQLGEKIEPGDLRRELPHQ